MTWNFRDIDQFLPSLVQMTDYVTSLFCRKQKSEKDRLLLAY